MAAGLDSEPAAPTDPQGSTPFTPSGAFVPPEPSELATRFADLEIIELLGAGGMGAYKARQKELDRLVAVKILPPEVGADPTFAERFSREAKALARLGRPNIVVVHDAGQRGGLFYFVMEYVDGVSLREAMRAGDLEPRQALSIVADICEALQYAHDAGVVHRDVKPENVLLTRDGRVKIADFGLAKLVREAAPDLSLTGTAHVMGTFRYIVPEQLEGAASVDHRADIYSLGVVFYELLTGEVPMGCFAPPSKKVQVDVRLDEVVLRSLEREPERRYQQASEVKSDVDVICADASNAEAAKTVSPASQDDRQAPPSSSWAEFKADATDVLGALFVIGTLCLPVLTLAPYVARSLAQDTWIHFLMLSPAFGFGIFLWFWRGVWNTSANEMRQTECASDDKKASTSGELETLKGALRVAIPASLAVSVLLPVWAIAAYVMESRVDQEWMGWHLFVPILGIGLFLWFCQPVLRILMLARSESRDLRDDENRPDGRATTNRNVAQPLDPAKISPSRVGQLLSILGGWLVPILLIAFSLSCHLVWKGIQFGHVGEDLYRYGFSDHFLRGRHVWTGQVAMGITLLMAAVYVVSGFVSRPGRLWRPGLSIVASIVILALVGIEMADISQSTITTTEQGPIELEGSRELNWNFADWWNANDFPPGEEILIRERPSDGILWALGWSFCLLISSVMQFKSGLREKLEDCSEPFKSARLNPKASPADTRSPCGARP